MPRDNLLRRALETSLRAVREAYPSLDERIEEIVLARRFILVRLRGPGVGLAFVGDYEPPPEELVLREVRVSELVRYAWGHPTLTGLALAAVNAATDALVKDSPSLPGLVKGGDVVEIVNPGPGELVALVGYIEGIARRLAERGARVVVYEDNPTHRALARRDGFKVNPGSQLLLDADDFDIVLASGASLVEPRIGLVLQAAKRARLRGFVGPTSSFHAAGAEALGVDFVAGVSVPRHNEDVVVKLVKAGYGFRRVSSHVTKWVWLSRQSY
ncbi:hypothetical protein CF15_00535 [Pyrodictium occultum]|uniref:Heavy-metal chelation domain-containing protein n=1 Tax=Pyrodictium occultum TaxID=2309 RepID=A0A0V8RTI3_PYROC|nr:hypothetical protein CF15_00535 [Pyrodictium occultum]